MGDEKDNPDDEQRDPCHSLHRFISVPRRRPYLREFLVRAECVAEQRRCTNLKSSFPGPSRRPKPGASSISIAIWQAMNPGVEAYVSDSEDAT